MSGRGKDMGGGAEQAARYKQYDYRAVSADHCLWGCNQWLEVYTCLMQPCCRPGGSIGACLCSMEGEEASLCFDVLRAPPCSFDGGSIAVFITCLSAIASGHLRLGGHHVQLVAVQSLQGREESCCSAPWNSRSYFVSQFVTG
jgi:hypothetical protein